MNGKLFNLTFGLIVFFVKYLFYDGSVFINN